MKELLFVFASEEINLWEFEAVRYATGTLKVKGYAVIIKNEFQEGNENFFFAFLRFLSTRRYGFLKNAFEKKKVNELPELSRLDEIPVYFKGLIINFSCRTLKNDNCKIWEFQYGKAGDKDYQLFGLAEIFNRENTIQSSVVELDGVNHPRIIYRTVSALHTLAFQRSLNEHFFKQTTFVRRLLRSDQVNYRGFADLIPQIVPLNKFKLGIVFLLIILRNRVKITIRNKKTKWTVRFSMVGQSQLSEYIKLDSPNGAFWADPFLCDRDSTMQLFVEEKLARKVNAHIAVIDFKDANYPTAKCIIEERYHLSYPFLFKFSNELFMIPESLMNRTINLYKCIEYPYKWEFVNYLMKEVDAVDTTLFNYNNKWWLFSNIREVEGASVQDELFLFFCENPISDVWKPHPLNPIVSDVTRSRPAGSVFVEDGKIIRPSQNSAKRYGHSVNFNHILKITEEEYEEVIISELKPWSDKIEALHTFNKLNNYSVIDTME